MASEELGLTYITDGHVIPYCTVRCDAVRSLAGPLLFRLIFYTLRSKVIAIC